VFRVLADQHTGFVQVRAHERGHFRNHGGERWGLHREISDKGRPLLQLGCVARESRSKRIWQSSRNFRSASSKCRGYRLSEAELVELEAPAEHPDIIKVFHAT